MDTEAASTTCSTSGRAEDRLWLDALRAESPDHDAALRLLHETARKAASHQVRRMPQVWSLLGSVRAEEVIDAAADEATAAVLASLDRFEGRSRFSTWVYKFGILHASAEARRAMWRDRPVDIDEHPEPAAPEIDGAVAIAEASDKALHDVRVKLRAELIGRGFLSEPVRR